MLKSFFSYFAPKEPGADIYVDLGTANTLVAVRNFGIVINEPSVVAFTESNGRRKLLGVGNKAVDIQSKNPGNVVFQKPVRDGVVADFDSAHSMLKYFLEVAQEKCKVYRPRVVVSLPYGVTEVEKKAIIAACRQAGASRVFLIDEPMAAAIGADLPVKEARGHMIIDIGGGTTEVAVIALADIVYCEALRLAGHKFDEEILSYFKENFNLIISSEQAEQLKKTYGTAMPKRNIKHFSLSGHDVDTGLPRSIDVSSENVGLAMNDCIQTLINAILNALENTPPELVSDIIENGIVLAGGGALIKDLDIRIKNEVRLEVRIAKDPLVAIARGGEAVLKDPQLLEKINIQ